MTASRQHWALFLVCPTFVLMPCDRNNVLIVVMCVVVVYLFVFPLCVPWLCRSWCPRGRSWRWRGRSYKQSWSTSGSVWRCHRHPGHEAAITRATPPGDPDTASRWPLQTDTQSLFFMAGSTRLHGGEYGWPRWTNGWMEWMERRRMNAEERGPFSEGETVFGLSHGRVPM